MTNYSVTIGYRAVIEVRVKAHSKEEAETKALDIFQKQKKKLSGARQDVSIEDDRYAADGVLNMDETWNSVN